MARLHSVRTKSNTHMHSSTDTSQKRLHEVQKAPFSWKERDILTAAEKYMNGALDLPLVDFVLPCFQEMDRDAAMKVAQVWRCLYAGYHLRKVAIEKEANFCNSIQLKAARIYEQEAQRILGSIFSLEHRFWTVFYNRQEEKESKLLIVIDAMYFNTGCKEPITYQLLQQCSNAIIKGYYSTLNLRRVHFESAKRLVINLPLMQLREWLNRQLT